MNDPILRSDEIDKATAKLQSAIARWRAYPPAFVMEACQAHLYGVPTNWQMETLVELPHKRRITIRSGHGVGKTRLMAWCLWWVMVCLHKPGKAMKVPCTGPSGSNLEDVLWSEIKVVHKHLHPFLADQFAVQTDKLFHMENQETWFAKLRTSRKENPDAMQGFHGDPMFFLVDEGSGVPDEVFQVIQGALSSRHAYALMFGNPVRLEGYFYRAHRPKRGKTGVWHTKRVDCRDQLDTVEQVYPYIEPNGDIREIRTYGRVTPTYIQEVIDEFGEDSPVFCARVSGEFPKSQSDQTVKEEWVAKAIDRMERTFDAEARVMGVDVAYKGEDDSSLVIRRGPEIEECDMWHGHDTDETAERVCARYIELRDAKKKVDYIVVDVNGVGAGVYDQIRKKLKSEMGEPVKVLPVYVGSPAPKDGKTQCRILRDWLWWQCRLFFKDRNPFFSCDRDAAYEMLLSDVTTPLYEQKEKAIWVEGKKEIRKRTGSSPDVGDALCLTFCISWGRFRHADVEHDQRGKKKRRRRGRKREGWRMRGA